MGTWRKLALGLMMTAGVTAGEAVTAKPAEAAPIADRETKDGRVEALDIGVVNFAPDVYTREQQNEIIAYLLFKDELFRSTVKKALEQDLHTMRSLTAKQYEQILRNAMQKEVNNVKILVEDPSAKYELASADVVPKDSGEREELLKTKVDNFIAKASLHTRKIK